MTIGAVRLHDQYTLGISEHGNVRVVRDENQLAMFFDAFDVLDDKAVNELVIEVVLRLVNQKGTLAFQQENRQDGIAFLPGGKAFRRLELAAIIQLNFHAVGNIDDLKSRKELRILQGCGDDSRLFRVEQRFLRKSLLVVVDDHADEVFRENVREARRNLTVVHVSPLETVFDKLNIFFLVRELIDRNANVRIQLFIDPFGNLAADFEALVQKHVQFLLKNIAGINGFANARPNPLMFFFGHKEFFVFVGDLATFGGALLILTALFNEGIVFHLLFLVT